MIDSGVISVAYKILPKVSPVVNSVIEANPVVVSRTRRSVRTTRGEGVVMLPIRRIAMDGKLVRKHLFKCTQCGRVWLWRKFAEKCARTDGGLSSITYGRGVDSRLYYPLAEELEGEV